MTTLNESSAEKLRVVVDTSVYVAAILKPGLSEEVLRTIYRGLAVLYCSEEIIQELKLRLSDSVFQTDPKRAKEAVQIISSVAKFVRPKQIDEPRLRDRDDAHILACAVAAKANVIVSLDQDLISLKAFQNIAIVHPRTFKWIIGKK